MKNKIISLSLILSVFIAFSSQAADPATEQRDYSKNLTGNWGGNRKALDDAGISTEITYKFDIVSNISGGKKDGIRFLDNTDIIFSFDGEKILDVKGLSAAIHFLNNFGGKPNGALVGSAQGVNNIEVLQPTAKLYQAFIEQNFWADKLSILIGLYDLNSEFYITDSSLLFIHPTFGIGTDFSQSGHNGPSIFPSTSVAGRVFLKPNDKTYVRAAILDAVAGNPDHLHGTHIKFDEDDGWLLVSEVGYTAENAKIAVGGWYYTEKFNHQTLTDTAGNPLKKHSKGTYIIGERKLYSDGADKGLTAFARLGFANGEVNRFNYAWSAGIVYTGLFPTRDEGKLGLGVTNAHNSSYYKKAELAAGKIVDSSETSFELTYSDKILPWLSIQPDLQYVINPDTDKTRKNAIILGTRFTANF